MILLPTLNRTKLVKEFFKSYRETAAEVPGLLLVDNDDLNSNRDSYSEIENEMPKNWRLVNTGLHRSMGDKVRCSEDKWREKDWVGILNDDHYCITKHWDKKVEAMLDGTNMVSTNDGNWNFGFRVVGLTAWSKPLLDACGFPIFPDGINHWFIDDVWKNIGDATGCWHETMQVNIEHRHAFIGKMQRDGTFLLSQSQEQAQKSMEAYKKFMENDFKAVCERVLKLRSEHVKKSKFV